MVATNAHSSAGITRIAAPHHDHPGRATRITTASMMIEAYAAERDQQHKVHGFLLCCTRKTNQFLNNSGWPRDQREVMLMMRGCKFQFKTELKANKNAGRTVDLPPIPR